MRVVRFEFLERAGLEIHIWEGGVGIQEVLESIDWMKSLKELMQIRKGG